jgi:Ribonuclease G/E
MARREIRVSVSPGEVRVAGLQDRLLQEVVVERSGQWDRVGDLHRARVVALAPAMSGAFLLLEDSATAFLPESELPGPRRPVAAALHEGQAVPVRVTRAAQGGKGPRVTARLTSPEEAAVAAAGPDAPRLIRRGDTAVERLATGWPEAHITTDSATLAGSLQNRFGKHRASLCLSPAMDPDLEAELEELGSPHVALPGGASLVIQPTAGLVAIDVDAGPSAGTRDPAAHLRVNLGALNELARQIRLRNLAGAILVDLAGLQVRKREVLIEPLAEAMRKDPLKPRLLGLTRLGFLEIVRPRVHPPLHEVVGLPPSPLTLGLGAVRKILRRSAATPGVDLGLRAAHEVIAALQRYPAALEEYERMSGSALDLQADRTLRPGEEQIVERCR